MGQLMTKIINLLSFYTALAIITIMFFSVRDVYSGPKTYPNYVHRTIYIQRDFDDFEQEQIIAAALEWTAATGHIIDFDVVQLPTTEAIDENGIFINRASVDHPDVILLDKTNNGTTLGYFDHDSRLPYIGLITNRINNKDYKGVVMHELGHALGLEHNYGETGIDTLMYPSINGGSYHIEKLDGKKLCQLYHCDYTKLKYQEKPFHL